MCSRHKGRLHRKAAPKSQLCCWSGYGASPSLSISGNKTRHTTRRESTNKECEADHCIMHLLKNREQSGQLWQIVKFCTQLFFLPKNMRIIFSRKKLRKKWFKRTKPEGGVCTGQSWFLKIPLNNSNDICFIDILCKHPLIANNFFLLFFQFVLIRAVVKRTTVFLRSGWP